MSAPALPEPCLHQHPGAFPHVPPAPTPSSTDAHLPVRPSKARLHLCESARTPLPTTRLCLPPSWPREEASTHPDARAPVCAICLSLSLCLSFSSPGISSDTSSGRGEVEKWTGRRGQGGDRAGTCSGVSQLARPLLLSALFPALHLCSKVSPVTLSGPVCWGHRWPQLSQVPPDRQSPCWAPPSWSW